MIHPACISLPALPLALRIGPLDFAEPNWLFAFLILIPVIYFWKTSRVPASPFRRGVSLVLRLILIAGMIGALAQTRLVWSSRGVCVIFLLDQSQSVGNEQRQGAREQLRRVVSSQMTKDDQFAVIEFAGDSVLSSLPSVQGAVPEPVPVNDTASTDISRAIRLAMATFPSDRQKRIVLISDGNQNSGDAMREARIAAMKDTDIESIVVGRTVEHEVMIESVTAPPRAQKGSRFLIRVVVSADQAQPARLLVRRDSRSLPTVEVQLKPGTNVFDIPDLLGDGGFHTYQVTVEPVDKSRDSIPTNNSGYAYTVVEAPGRVLLVRGKSGSEDYLSPALGAKLTDDDGKILLDVGDANALQVSIDGYARYDCVVLENVDSKQLTRHQMDALELWVKDVGGGAVLIGGDQSFGPGFWKDTPLEAISPLEMDVRRTKHLASLAMVIVIDKSGSMGVEVPKPGGGMVEKITLATSGAAATLNVLDALDAAQIGVVDTEVKWATGAELLRMTPDNKDRVRSNTESARSGGGGILCATALTRAYELLNDPKVDAMARHVIMFADATDSEQQENCVAMAKKNYEKKPSITTSVIGMGNLSDPHTPFLQDVAKAGHGHFHIADDPMNIYRLFLKEMYIKKRAWWVEDAKGITPRIFSSPLVEGFQRTGVPKVYGYVGSTLKPRATMALHGRDIDDPLLAHWNYGLGKVVAFTSDDSGQWGKDWVAWPGFQKFWVQTVRWACRNKGSTALATTTTIDGTNGKITVDAANADGKPINDLKLEANVLNEHAGSETMRLKLTQTAPGQYVAEFPAKQRGTYIVGVIDPRTKGIVGASGAVMNYAAEFRDLSPNAGFMSSLSEASSGNVLTALDGVFKPKPFSVKSFRVLWDALLIAVASALFFDIAWRRLNFADWLRAKSVPTGLRSARGDTMGAFKAVKSGRAQVAAVHKDLRERVPTKAATAVDLSTPAEVPTAVAEQTVTQLAPPEKAETAPEGGYAGALLRAKRRAADAIKEQEKK